MRESGGIDRVGAESRRWRRGRREGGDEEGEGDARCHDFFFFVVVVVFFFVVVVVVVVFVVVGPAIIVRGRQEETRRGTEAERIAR
jgi:hypothetical protein